MRLYYPKSKINELPHPRDNPFVRPRGDSRPIHRLPFELLARIFQFGAAYNDRKYDEVHTSSTYKLLEEAADQMKWFQSRSETTSSSSESSPMVFPLIVSHVSRHWRNIAISTPSIWTDIRISPDSMRPPYELVSLHLERSRNLPIDIHMTVGGNVESDDGTETVPVTTGMSFSEAKLLYSLFIPNIHRWRSVEITALESNQTRAFIEAISQPSSPPALQLTSLRLHFNDVKTQPVSMHFPTFFNGLAPQLQDVLLCGVHVDWGQTWISSNTNLTSLQLLLHYPDVRPSWTQFTTILRGAPALRKLALYFSGPAEPPEDWMVVSEPTPTSALLHLTDLVLGSVSEDVAIIFLRKFYMPALTGLILDFGGADYSDAIKELLWPTTPHNSSFVEAQTYSLISRLERLAIFHLSCEEDLIVQMFEQLTSLKSLRISLREESDESSIFLDLLLRDRFLRKLQNLFLCPARGGFPFLRKIVQQRIDAGIPLKSIYLPWEESYDLEDEDEEWFRDRLEKLSPVNRVYCWNTDHAFETEWVV